MAAAEVTAVGPTLSFSIKRMTEHDLLEVVEIEELSGLSRWGWDAYHKELQSPEDVIMLIARVVGIDANLNEGKGIAGFIVAHVVADEMHVNNIAVRTEFRRQGLRSEERRVGKECRSRWWPCHGRKRRAREGE